VQRDRSWVIGQYGAGEYAFWGNISHFTVLHDVGGDEEAVMRYVRQTRNLENRGANLLSIDKLHAVYPLVDAASEVILSLNMTHLPLLRNPVESLRYRSVITSRSLHNRLTIEAQTLWSRCGTDVQSQRKRRAFVSESLW
jgi:hypothetical protein